MAGVREHVDGLLGDDGGDPRWRDHLEDLRYDGEAVRETVSVGDARVVVTSHRVLAYTPDGDGPNFRQVERPNVVGVDLGAESNRGLLLRGIKWGVAGLLLLGAGTFVDLDAILGDVSLGGAGGAGVGMGGILGVVQQFLALLRQLDELLQLFGGLVLLLSAVAFGAYLVTRDPRLVLTVAGDEADDVTLPRPLDPHDAVERLERAIFPDGTGAATTGSDHGETGRTGTSPTTTRDEDQLGEPAAADPNGNPSPTVPEDDGDPAAVDPDAVSLDDDPLDEP